jgi:hypothetical protein
MYVTSFETAFIMSCENALIYGNHENLKVLKLLTILQLLDDCYYDQEH